MVFVTVGTRLEPMMRLLVAVDELAGQGILEDVLVQAGSNPDFHPKHCRSERLIALEAFEEHVRRSELVISHAGAGTAIQVLRAGKVAVMMPRRLKYHENVDDHQLELVSALAAQDRIVPAYEPADLPSAIAEARRRAALARPAEPTRMMQLVKDALLDLTMR